MTLHRRPPRAWVRTVTVSTAAGCLLLATGGASAQAGASVEGPAMPRALYAAVVSSTRADHALVADARALGSCLSRHRRLAGRCRARRRGVQRAGSSLTAAERRLARLASAVPAGAEARSASTLQAPVLSVSRRRLTWTRVGRVGSYVLISETAGRANHYSVIRGTAVTPPAVTGATVEYAVRTAVAYSTWSNWERISYTSAADTPGPSRKASPPSPTTPLPSEEIDPQAAPALSVSGQTLTWSAIAGVKTYVLASKAPGQHEKFSVVNGTSTTPAAVPGATVRYSVRTAVDGSEWSPEVTISYGGAPREESPASKEEKAEEKPTGKEEGKQEGPAPKEEGSPPKEEAPFDDSRFEPGINDGWNLTLDVGGAAELGAKVVRVGFDINTPPALLEPVIAGYAAKGVRVAPLAEFYGTMPTPAEARGLASWATTFGPGGSFWAHRDDGQLAIQTIEFGNETSAGYQYGDDNAGEPGYMERARNYAIREKEAAEAIAASGEKVGLLSQGEEWTGYWMKGMFSAVPNLYDYIAGWVVHLYGPEWRSNVEDMIKQAAEHGAPATLPIDVTEWGISTDNTDCVTENYGWSPCMTYQEAAETLRRNTREIRQMLGSRLGQFMLYQVRDQEEPGESHNPFAYFGLLQHELAPKGAYTTAAEEFLAE
jgi:hypothetical protein